MDKIGTNFDDQIACGSGHAAIGLGGNDVLYSVPGTGLADQILLGGAGNDTYVAAPNGSIVILEKGGGYDVLNVSIRAMSTNTYAYTIGQDLLLMGDYGTGCFVVIPDATDFSIEVINFLDVSFSFRDFFMLSRPGMANFSAYTNSTTYYLNTLANAYSAAAEQPANIGYNQVLPPAPTPTPDPIPPVPDPIPPAPPSAVDVAVAQFFNAEQYLQNKTAALQAEGVSISVEGTGQAIASLGLSAWDHYRLFGAFERNSAGELGIDPGASFDTSKYYEAKAAQCAANGQQYTPEQLAAFFQSVGLDPLTHYALYGQGEGIQAQPVTPVGVDASAEWAVA